MDGESLEAYRHRLDGAAIFTYVLAMVMVPSKIWCRFKTGGMATVGWDDALSVVTLVFANAFFYISMIGLRPYLGRHVGVDVTIPEVVDFLRYLFAASLTYIWAIAFIKFTILAFYWKLFSITMRIPIGIIAATVFAWLIGLFFTAIFSCNPVEAQWNILITDATCIEQRALYLGGSLPNVIIDFVLVFTPIPYVWRLHAPVAQRIVLASMFALGIFVGIVSIVRLTITLSIPKGDMDTTYNLRDFILWSMVEINIGLVCTCLPSMRPMLRILGLSQFFSSVRGSGGTPQVRASGPSSGGQSGPTTAQRSEMSRPSRKKGSTGGLFSTIAGLTRLDSNEDEDSFQMIQPQAAHHGSGKTTTKVGVGHITPDTDNYSYGSSRD